MSQPIHAPTVEAGSMAGSPRFDRPGGVPVPHLPIDIDRRLGIVLDKLGHGPAVSALEPPADRTDGEVATLFGISRRTLRSYEQRNLLRPTCDDGHRTYGRRDVARLRLIRALRELRAPLAAIATVLAVLEDCDDDAVVFRRIEGLLVAIESDFRERIVKLIALERRIVDTIERFTVAA